MLELGKLPRDCPEVTDSDIPPLRLHGVVFWDEHHKNVLLGGTGNMKREYTYEELHPDKGGPLPD